MEIDFLSNIEVFLIILMRMSGFIFFDSIFGRKNIPNVLKVGFTVLFSISVYNSHFTTTTMELDNLIVFSIISIKEMSIGFILGYIMKMFLSVLAIGGQIIDMQLGISMAKIFDPQSNTSLPISTNLMNIVYIFVFFIMNGHLTLVKIFITSFKLIPLDGIIFTEGLFLNLVSLFSLIMILSVKLAMPIIGIQLITETSVGILMKAIPQINVFIVNLQLKILVGLIMLTFTMPYLADFSEEMIKTFYKTVEDILVSFGS